MKMTANPTVVNTNEFFCVPVGKSRQANILGEPCEERHRGGQKNPQKTEMGSDLVTWACA